MRPASSLLLVHRICFIVGALACMACSGVRIWDALMSNGADYFVAHMAGAGARIYCHFCAGFVVVRAFLWYTCIFYASILRRGWRHDEIVSCEGYG